jgi:hypothetical protein
VSHWSWPPAPITGNRHHKPMFVQNSYNVKNKQTKVKRAYSSFSTTKCVCIVKLENGMCTETVNMWKEMAVTYFKIYCITCLNGVRKTTQASLNVMGKTVAQCLKLSHNHFLPHPLKSITD